MEKLNSLGSENLRMEASCGVDTLYQEGGGMGKNSVGEEEPITED